MTRITNQYRLPFGKYAGQALPDVPSNYLSWLLRATKLSAPLRTAVRQELLSRNDCPQLPPEPATKVVTCQRCDSTDLAVSWVSQAGGRRALRADCRACGRF